MKKSYHFFLRDQSYGENSRETHTCSKFFQGCVFESLLFNLITAINLKASSFTLFVILPIQIKYMLFYILCSFCTYLVPI